MSLRQTQKNARQNKSINIVPMAYRENNFHVTKSKGKSRILNAMQYKYNALYITQMLETIPFIYILNITYTLGNI